MDRDGQKQIDVSELLRVFGKLQSLNSKPTTTSDRLRLTQKTEKETPNLYQVELEKLRVQLEFKDAELALAKERISELKSREHQVVEEKNRLLTLIEQQSRLLAAPIQKPAARKKVALPVTEVIPKTAAPKVKVPQQDSKPPAVKAAGSKPVSKAPAKKQTTK